MYEQGWRKAGRHLAAAGAMLVLLSPEMLPAQPAPAAERAGTVVYGTRFNGRESPDGRRTVVEYRAGVARIAPGPSARPLIPGTPDEATYLDFAAERVLNVADVRDGARYSTSRSFGELPAFAYTGAQDTVLGVPCEVATTTLRSNHIEACVARGTGLRGTPAPEYGVPDGLVLRVVRNNSMEIAAREIGYHRRAPRAGLLPDSFGEQVGDAVFRQKKVESLVVTVPVFDNEPIDWGNERVNPDDLDAAGRTFHFSGGTVVLKKVTLPAVEDGTRVFAEVTQFSEGDAYDRTGSVFLVPTDREQSFLAALRQGVDHVPAVTGSDGKRYQGIVATDEYLPPLELMRFFTPFGVREFNDRVQVAGVEWQDSALFKQDVTELLPRLQGEAWIGAFIGNYAKQGHRLSLRLHFHPGSPYVAATPKKRSWVMPLFNTLNVMEMTGQEYGTLFGTDSLAVTFAVPEGVKNLRLRYTSTGHGGWGGGDEFNKKLNEIFVDGERVYAFVPWREDCATYRSLNPASGNFWNGTSSSDLSRSNWCPGTVTNPVDVPLGHLKPGPHRLQVAIPLGPREGESFSHWGVSGVLIGEFEG